MPDEDWVTLTYVDKGVVGVVTIPWRVYTVTDFQNRFASKPDVASGHTLFRGIDFSTALINDGLNNLFLRSETRSGSSVLYFG